MRINADISTDVVLNIKNAKDKVAGRLVIKLERTGIAQAVLSAVGTARHTVDSQLINTERRSAGADVIEGVADGFQSDFAKSLRNVASKIEVVVELGDKLAKV